MANQNASSKRNTWQTERFCSDEAEAWRENHVEQGFEVRFALLTEPQILSSFTYPACGLLLSSFISYDKKTKNSLAFGGLAQFPISVSGEIIAPAKHRLPVPMDPRVKLIQWSVSDHLKIISMTGDFTGLGIVDSAELNGQLALELKQLQIFEMLQGEQTQELFDKFQTAMRTGETPQTCQLRLYSGDKVRWVE